MKPVKISLFSPVTIGLIFSFAFAAGDAEKGKAMFNDPKLSGATSGKTCGSCHPDGKGLEQAADKKEWKTPAGFSNTLEDTINICITVALRGKALDPKSPEMANMVAYIRSLKNKAGVSEQEKPKAKKKPAEGC
ncbi:MAG TPA: hypothetical protein VEI96_10025 [Thermodesulfovibrionales bacterium]|nr:hypothetical protein [Thermodesulfovibrionales bacterium]